MGAIAIATPAFAASISGPLSAADIRAMNAIYGPQTAVRAHDNSVGGPLTFASAATVDLYGASGTADVASLLFLISMAPTSSLGVNMVTIDFISPDFTVVSLGALDFFAGGPDPGSGFPLTPPGGPGVEGEGNGEVNGISFPEALHGGVEVVLDDISTFTDGVWVAGLAVSTPVNLRIDIFGLNSDGVIINNTPNSGAFGVIPEPATVTLLGMGIAGLAYRRIRG